MNLETFASLIRPGVLALAVVCLLPSPSRADATPAEIERMIEQRLQNYQYITPALAENPELKVEMVAEARPTGRA